MRRSVPLALSALSLGASTLLVPAEAIGASTLTGKTVSTGWGYIAVTIEVSGKKISTLTWNVTQDGFPHSIQLNSFALPKLKREALKAESYKIHTVAGATQTSQAFSQSLQSALTKAHLD